MKVIKQSGVVPFYIKDGVLNIVLVTSRKDRKWIFPKGHLEPDMTPAESAEQEALEEAGVTGKLLDEHLGVYTFERFGNRYEVDVFLLEVDHVMETWDESSFRDRCMVPVYKALELVGYEPLKEVLRSVPERIKSKGDTT